eukprot:1001999-Pelagomonas_calceolata.AAC.1
MVHFLVYAIPCLTGCVCQNAAVLPRPLTPDHLHVACGPEVSLEQSRAIYAALRQAGSEAASKPYRIELSPGCVSAVPTTRTFGIWTMYRQGWVPEKGIRALTTWQRFNLWLAFVQ